MDGEGLVVVLRRIRVLHRCGGWSRLRGRVGGRRGGPAFTGAGARTCRARTFAPDIRSLAVAISFGTLQRSFVRGAGASGTTSRRPGLRRAPKIWAGVDIGNEHHHCVVIDAQGKRLLSRRVLNDEPVLLELIGDVLTLSEDVLWAVDINHGGAALLIGLFLGHGQPMAYLTGLAGAPGIRRLPRPGQDQRQAAKPLRLA